jgi:hypothetical protein
LFYLLEEIAMAKVNISKMDVQSLMDLRKRVDERLLEHRAEQLAAKELLAAGDAGVH